MTWNVEQSATSCIFVIFLERATLSQSTFHFILRFFCERIMSFSSLRDPSGRTNIAARSDFNFTLRGIDVIGFAQEVQDLRIALVSAPRFRTSLFQSLYKKRI